MGPGLSPAWCLGLLPHRSCLCRDLYLFMQDLGVPENHTAQTPWIQSWVAGCYLVVTGWEKGWGLCYLLALG